MQLGHKVDCSQIYQIYLIKMLHALLFGIDMVVQVPKDLRFLVVYNFAVILNNYYTRNLFNGSYPILMLIPYQWY